MRMGNLHSLPTLQIRGRDGLEVGGGRVSTSRLNFPQIPSDAVAFQNGEREGGKRRKIKKAWRGTRGTRKKTLPLIHVLFAYDEVARPWNPNQYR